MRSRASSLALTFAGSPLAVAGFVFALYSAWIGIARARGHGAYDFAFIGEFFLNRSAESPMIEANAQYALAGTGYDGQFFLFIAQDPVHAQHYLDDAGYRYGRILYPMAARVTAIGVDIDIASALVAVNVLAVSLGVFALALWLRRSGLSPWLALVFGLYPGVFVAVLRDLSEGIAYALVALAVLLFDRSRPSHLAASAGLFALAVFTRETTAIFAVVWAGALLFEGRGSRANWRRAGVFAAASLVPYLAYRCSLWAWLGTAGTPDQLRPTLVPFGGILDWWPWGSADIQQVYAVVLPGIVCLGLALWALRRRNFDPAVVALAVNALLFVVLIPAPVFSDYYSSLRIPTGVVLALLLAAPTFQRIFGPTRTWLWVPVVAWFSPWWQLLPLALDRNW